MTTATSIVWDAVSHLGEVARIDVQRSPYSTSSLIDEVTVFFADGSSTRLLHKDLRRDGLLPEAQGTKPEFVWDPGREVYVYESLLAGARLGTATCYASTADSLLLEKVDGVELWQVGDLRVWREVAAWLPTMHERLRLQAAVAAVSTRLLRYDRAYYERWPRRASHFLRHADPSARRRLAWVTARHATFLPVLLDAPATVVHGELFASNVLVAATNGGTRICPVDWEMAAVGPALVDLATLTAGWGRSERDLMVESYAATAGGTASDALLFELCRLHLCLRTLGWCEGWKPPAEHSRDWLGEAVEIADALPG